MNTIWTPSQKGGGDGGCGSVGATIYHFSDYSTFERDALKYWKIYFDLGYYTLLIPFRFQYNSSTHQYRMRTSKLQRLLRLLLFSLATIFFLFNVLYRYRLIASARHKHGGNVNPTEYFDLISYVSDTLFMLPMFYALGKNQRIIEEIFHQIQPDVRLLELKTINYRSTMQLNNYLQGAVGAASNAAQCRACPAKSSQKSKLITHGLNILTMLITIMYFLDIFQEGSWSLSEIVRFFENEADKVFGILCTVNNANAKTGSSALGHSGSNSFHAPAAGINTSGSVGSGECSCAAGMCTFFAVIVFIGNWADIMINTYGDFMFTVTAFLFHDLVYAFKLELQNGLLNEAMTGVGVGAVGPTNIVAKGEFPARVGIGMKNLNEQDPTGVDKILAHYERLKSITRKINSAMGTVTFTFVIGNLPFFVINVFDVLDDSTSNFMRTITLFVCGYFFGSLFLAAKANSDVGELRQWLWRNENYTKMSSAKLSVLVQEINSSHPVALNAYGCLMINYTQFGSIVSIILTYTFIKFQFQGST